jgi:glutathione gamma-glutamylcysteinyltransferase
MRRALLAKSNSRIIFGGRECVHDRVVGESIRNWNHFSKLPQNVDKPLQWTKASFSSMVVQSHADNLSEHHHHDHSQSSILIENDDKAKHCDTCTCEDHIETEMEPLEEELEELVCHDICHDDYLNNNLPLPPPLPEPKYSFHRRVMPSSLVQFSSPDGRRMFQQSLASGTGNAFFPLSEQFLNQSDPAYCGVTTLIMVLNAIGIDPNVRWKGGWRWFGSEEMILESCCINPERVRRAGILLEEFYSLARCKGLRVDMKRPNLPNSTNGEIPIIEDSDTEKYHSLDEFRKDIIHATSNPPAYSAEDGTDTDGGFMVVSFSRSDLGQTGDGHFSPIAAYSKETDKCLILDVARFKYPPYWVSVEELYEAMRPKDVVTNKSRGWFMMYPPTERHRDCDVPVFKGTKSRNEGKRPADIVPLAGEVKGQVCPIGDIKVKYCSINKN